MRHSPALLLPLAVRASLALLPREAQAQRYTGGRPGQALGPASGTLDSSRRPPPTALPGMAARGNIEPIPADPNANLAPTPALFDAINRGDLFAARDAVARGADPDATNVLGLTPLDTAVDQGRNDIMFFLLSVRGARPTGGPNEPTATAFRSQPAVPQAPTRPGRPARPPVEAASSVAAPRLPAPALPASRAAKPASSVARSPASGARMAATSSRSSGAWASGKTRRPSASVVSATCSPASSSRSRSGVSVSFST
jgi:hypothetical protein